MSVIDSALELAGYGLRVFPVASFGRKIPLTFNGFKDASSEPDEVLHLFQGKHDARIGVVHDFALIVDVDGDEGKESFKGLEHKLGEPVAVVTTPSGGFHYYMDVGKYQAGRRLIRVRPGIDILSGDRGYVVVPPSKGYTFVRGGWGTIVEGLKGA